MRNTIERSLKKIATTEVLHALLISLLALSAAVSAQVPTQDNGPARTNASTIKDGRSVLTAAVTDESKESMSDEKAYDIARPRTPAPANQNSAKKNWHFGVTPYAFAPAISGTIGARGRTLEVDAGVFDVLKKVDMLLMGTFEARKGRFVSFNDFMWAKLSTEGDTRGGLYGSAKVGINLLIVDPEVGYRFVDSDRGSVDVLAGARIWSVEGNLNATSGLLPGFDVSQRKTWAAPVVGVRGVGNLSSKFFVNGKFDIGGAGIGADLTTQFYGGAGYKVHKNIAIVGGFRWLQVDYDDGSGFIFKTHMTGPVFGAKFSF